VLPGHPQPLSKRDLAEHFVSGETVFSGRLLQVHRDTVRLPDGGTGTREYIRHPGAVLALPLFDDGSVLLERQYRYPSACHFLELPAGKREPGEPPLETAKRELLEETGYLAREWTTLGALHTTVAFTDEVIDFYLARGLEFRGAKLDEGEFLETLVVPFGEALEMVRDGRITDSKTSVALLYYQVFVGGIDKP